MLLFTWDPREYFYFKSSSVYEKGGKIEIRLCIALLGNALIAEETETKSKKGRKKRRIKIHEHAQRLL